MAGTMNKSGAKPLTVTEMGKLQRLADSDDPAAVQEYYRLLEAKGYETPKADTKSGLRQMKADFARRKLKWREDPAKAVELTAEEGPILRTQHEQYLRNPATAPSVHEIFNHSHELADIEQAMGFYGKRPDFQKRLERKYDTDVKAPSAWGGIRRPVLGIWGNIIRDQLDDPFAVKMFERYWRGFGDYRMTDQEFSSLMENLKDDKGNLKIRPATDGAGIRPQPKFFVQDNKRYRAEKTEFYDSRAERALGDAWLIYEEGDVSQAPVGLYDEYDFNSKPFFGKGSRRKIRNEIDTRLVSMASLAEPKTRDFVIRYGVSPEKLQ